MFSLGVTKKTIFIIYYLASFFFRRSLFLDGPTHNLPPVTCNLVDKKLDPTSLTKLSFEVEGMAIVSDFEPQRLLNFF